MQLDRRLLSLLNSHYLAFAAPLAVGFLGGVLVVLQASLLSRIVNSAFLQNETLGELSHWMLLLMIVIIGRGLLAWVSDYLANWLGIKIKSNLHTQLFDHLNQLGPAYLKPGPRAQGVPTGELIQVLDQGLEAVQGYFSHYLPQLALAVLIPLTVLIFILPIDTLSAVILMVTAPLIPFFMVLIGDRSRELTKRQWTTLSRMSAYFLDVIQGLGTLKIFDRSKEQVQVIAQIGDRYRNTTMGVLKVTFISALALEWLAMLSTAVVAVEIGLRLLYGRLVFEQAFTVLLLAPEFYRPLRMLGSRFHAGMDGVTAAGKIFEILGVKPRAANPPTRVSTSSRRPTEEPKAPLSIEFENVRFGFDHNEDILRGVSFKIPAGKVTALVGPSGAGKSSIADLLLGFNVPKGGRILVNQRPIETIPDEAWSPQVAWVPQQPYLFNTSILENIRMAKPSTNQEQVITSAKLAYAHEFVTHLPDGYHTLIGERGARLSAGQAQRIALARAYLKDAPLLILDEATANLDPQNAQEIHAALLGMVPKRTVLVIAHHLPTIQNAHQVIVLTGGKVVETGEYHQMISKDGFLKRMLDSELAVPNRPRHIPVDQAFPARVDLLRSHQPAPGDARTVSLSSLKSLLQLLAPYRWQVLLSVLLGWATVVSGMGLLGTSAYIISAAALQPSIAFLQVPIVAVRAFGIGRGLFRYLERYVTHENTFRLISQIRVWFYQELEPLAPAAMLEYRSGDLLSRVRQDLSILEDFYVRVVAPPLVWILVSIFAAAFLAFFSIPLSLAVFAFQLLAGMIVPLMLRYFYWGPERSLIHTRADLSAALVDAIQGMGEIRIFDTADTHRKRILKLNQASAGHELKLGAISSLADALETTLAHFAAWIVLVLCIPLVSSGQIDGVYLGTLLLVALASFEAASPLPQAAQILQRGLEAAGRLEEIASRPPQVIDPPAPLPAPTSPNLEIIDLDFAYPRMDQGAGTEFVLRGINFDLPPGKRLGIIGPSGAGKTSLVNLLLRFWDYHQGQVLLDQVDLHRYRQDDVRRLISVVTQPVFLFNGTLGDNLRLAKPAASDAELRNVCNRAWLNEYLSALPDGFETWIGEGGSRLSAGERQRLAIARALLKGAPILILDELTAHLDPLTERDVVTSILEHTRWYSVLWITHRLVGMPAMDEILVLRDGQAVERGKHQELLDLRGYYWRMYQLQEQTV